MRIYDAYLRAYAVEKSHDVERVLPGHCGTLLQLGLDASSDFTQFVAVAPPSKGKFFDSVGVPTSAIPAGPHP